MTSATTRALTSRPAGGSDTPAGRAIAPRYARPVVSGPPGFTWHYRLLGGLAVEGADGRRARPLGGASSGPSWPPCCSTWTGRCPRTSSSTGSGATRPRPGLPRPCRRTSRSCGASSSPDDPTAPGTPSSSPSRGCAGSRRRATPSTWLGSTTLRLAATAVPGRRRRGHRRRPLRRGPPPPRPAASRAGR